MKKFIFPLARVLSWRQTQTRLEEAALARLQTELQSLDLRCQALDQSVQDARTQLLAAPSATPIELGAMEHYRASTAAQIGFLLQSRGTLEQKLAQQTQTVLERRRDARLLEQLRDRRHTAWKTAADREIEQQAEESYMARSARNALE